MGGFIQIPVNGGARLEYAQVPADAMQDPVNVGGMGAAFAWAAVDNQIRFDCLEITASETGPTGITSITATPDTTEYMIVFIMYFD